MFSQQDDCAARTLHAPQAQSIQRASAAKALTTLLLAFVLGACGSSNNGSLGVAAGPGDGGAGGGDMGARMCAVSLPAPATMLTPAEPACSDRGDDRLLAMSDAGIGSTSELGLAPGRYALPASAQPTKMVIMFHGHQNDSCAFRDHLRLAAEHGAVAVAMDYSDQEDRNVDGIGFVRNWGWAVRSGAADSIQAAQFFMKRYPTITEVVNFGVSMGGNVSGYAAYFDGATRADCSPMWDYWIAGEGVHNLTEEYNGAKAVAAALEVTGTAGLSADELEDFELAKQLILEVDEENGGSFDQVPERYQEITNVSNVGNLAYLKGAVMTHGTQDTTVPYDQSQQMTRALRLVGVPSYFYTVTGAGHAWEGDPSLQVIKLALGEMVRILDGGVVVSGDATVAGP